jgi:polyisoprenoid-binding protein YceI
MGKWIIDPDHSVAAFSVRHLIIADVRGQFNRIGGTVTFDPADSAGLSLEAVIDAAGIYTGIAKRDEHLRSPDFLDVAQYPAITFRSAGFEVRGAGKGRLAGELSIHGVTRPVLLDVSIAGPVQCPEEIGGETTMGISAGITLNREDFGMSWNIPMPGGPLAVGLDVTIRLDIEADLEE